MYTTGHKDKWTARKKGGVCACAQLRRAARKVSSFYDTMLTPSGLTNTQHALLINVARAGEVSRTALAERLGMDRTTLTRNLKPLERAHLIVSAASDDRRERLLRLSPSGGRVLKRSYALWEEAQKRFQREIGDDMLQQLAKVLSAVEAATEAAMNKKRRDSLPIREGSATLSVK